tara:strand:- start:1474 stop:2469 length:996 start_codon:yes stop_codon:yes gene_type:complete
MISALEISKLINGKILGDENLVINGVCDIEVGKDSCITYLKNSSFEKYISKNKASLFIVDKHFDIKKYDRNFLIVENPAISFIKVLNFFKSKKILQKTGISNKANISPKSKIGKNVYIGPNVFIEEGSIISDNVSIHAGSYIGFNTLIKKNSEICANVSIHENVIIGENCRIDSGTVIGSEGFGIISSTTNNYNIPHVGSVIIGNHVTIGSNCSIDRGTINNTIISEFTKLDNLIQIGHNVKIGKNCLIASQVGIAGSTTVGDNVTIAGQTGIIDHLNIGNNTTIAVKSCVYKSLPEKSFVSGIPAINHLDKLKQDAILKRLPLIYKNIKK